MQTLDFSRSYYRFYIDLEGRQAISLSHKPPTRTNRTRILLEASCQLTHRPTGRATTYYLSAPCKTERVGADRHELWLLPSADVTFLLSDDGQIAVYKSWIRNDMGVMRHPASLGPQPERQAMRAEDNFDELTLDLHPVTGTALTDYDAVAEAILSTVPLVSRIAYSDGDYDVVIDQPVKTINLCERDGLYQTDTGPIILPDFSPGRLADGDLAISRFDLAYSAWHARDWAEFIVNIPTPVTDDISANHYSHARHISPTVNTLIALTD